MLEEAEGLEEKFALTELARLNELKRAVKTRNSEDVKNSVIQLSALEFEINKSHQNMIAQIAAVSDEFPDRSRTLRKAEAYVEEVTKRLFKLISARSGVLFRLAMQKELNFELINSAIERTEQLIRQWISLIKQIKDKFKVTEKEYKKIIAASQEKLLDLLKGKGKYRFKTHKKRVELWNRWARLTAQRVIKNAELQGADLQGFNLSEFVFRGKTNLRKANLSQANLERANLAGADLSYARLVNANLEGVNLFRANLKGADLRGANLTNANLAEANLEGANLDKAELVNSKGITQEQIMQAVNFEKVITRPQVEIEERVVKGFGMK